MGTREYLSPEVLSTDGTTYEWNTKDDAWSLGVLLYGLFYGQVPYPYNRDLSPAENKEYIIDPYLDNRVKPQDKDSIDYVIWSLMHKDPNQRMDLKVAHEKIKNAKFP